MALKDDLIEKALRRTKLPTKKSKSENYSHFKIYEHPPTTIIEKELDTNSKQSGHKPDTNRIQNGRKDIENKEFPAFAYYVGLQKKILLLFYFDCKNNGSMETQEITLHNIADTLKVKIGSIKTSIRRLEDKRAIRRTKFKNGRNGWSKYELEEMLYREIGEYEEKNKLDTNWEQTGNKLNTNRIQTEYKLGTIFSYS